MTIIIIDDDVEKPWASIRLHETKYRVVDILAKVGENWEYKKQIRSQRY